MQLNWSLMSGAAAPASVNSSARAIDGSDTYYYNVAKISGAAINRGGQKNGTAPSTFNCIKR